MHSDQHSKAGDWEVCFQLQAKENSVNKDHGMTMQFENISMRKFDAHRILSCFVFVDCLLKVFIITQCWKVTTILDLSVTFWSFPKKLTKWDLSEPKKRY